MARCPTCGRECGPDARFCEVDGTRLPRDAPATARLMACACGAGLGVDSGDGYCERCGMRLRPAAGPDDGDLSAYRVLAPAPDLAAVGHRGAAHQLDEDAVAVARRKRGGPLHVLVVCDGVSGSSHGELAAAAAAEAALGVLLAAADGPDPVDRPASLREAVRAAHRAACAPGGEPVPGKDPSGTTLVAALAHEGRVDVAWVGDSRAYLLEPPAQTGEPAAALLTHDHSWVNEMVDAGRLTPAAAARSRNAHVLTHCLGPLEDPDPESAPEASLTTVETAPGSRLLLCSDGLWNGAAGPGELAALVASTPAPDALTLALNLVRRTLTMGGQDDVTVAVAFL